MNINRDYLIINDVKKSNVKLDNGSIFFYITDKNTQNIFVNLVINVSNNNLIQKYANIENAEDYTLTMNIVKPDNTYKIIEGKLHDKEKAIFEFDLKEDCVDKIGTYRCELLTKCTINDREEITTSNKITYKVKSSILNDLDDIVEAPEYPLVIQLFDKLSDIEQYEEDRRANELARQLAEEQRQTRFNALDADMVDRVNAMDSKMDDVENRISAKEQAVDKLIVDTKADIDDYKVAKDAEIDEYKTAKDQQIDQAIADQNNKIDTAIAEQNNRIEIIETNDNTQNTRLDALEAKDIAHETSITNIEAKNVEQDNRLDSIEAVNVSQDNRLDAIEIKNQQQDDRLLDVEKINKRQDMDLKCLFAESKNNMIDVTEEGNSIYLQNSTTGYTLIDEIKGNTMVNCNKEPDKELILNGNINTQGYNNVTITEGVDGGLVDVALEGNTMVNVCDQKDPVAITKSYTVETGNHVALQGEYDGKCRPVVTGNTLVNLCNDKFGFSSDADKVGNIYHKGYFKINKSSTKNYHYITISKDDAMSIFKPNTKYTLIVNIITNTIVQNGGTQNTFQSSTYNYGNYIIESSTDGPYSCVFKGNETGQKMCVVTTKDFDNPSHPINYGIQFNTTFYGVSGILEGYITILEGDYTNKPIPDYFEGLQSSFEDNLVTQEMVDNGEESAENLGKYKVDYVISQEDGTIGQTKTFYLNSPLLEGDTIEQQGNDVVHAHRYRKVVLDGSEDEKYYAYTTYEGNIAFNYNYGNYPCKIYGNYIKNTSMSFVMGSNLDIRPFNSGLDITTVDELRSYFNNNITTLVYELRNIEYEVISANDTILCDSYVNGHLDVDSVVPVEKVVFEGTTTSRMKYMYPSTDYILQFESNNVGKIYKWNINNNYFNGFDVVKGINKIHFTTGDTIYDLFLKANISGIGFNASNIVVTEATDQDFGYFEGMKSVGECEDLEVVSSNSDGTLSNTQTLTHEPLRAVGDIKDKYVLIDGKWYIERNCGVRVYQEGDINNYITDMVNTVYPLSTPTYEPIDYNPFEVYSDITHISNNSTIPCNMTIKNTGYNCLLKPSTTYTISSNLGLNTVTTGADIGDSCLRFMDTDTSDVTTMKDVLVLEGDWTTKADVIPANFSGIESAFEQEYDAEKGKYKVNVKVANEDKSKENNITFYINEPLRGIGDIKDKVYVKNDKVVVERNCGSVTFDGSDDEGWLYSTNGNLTYRFVKEFISTNKNCVCNTFIVEDNSGRDAELIFADSVGTKLYVRINKSKLQTQDISGFRQWLQQNPTTVVYQLAEPTYEEVEYNDVKLFIESFKNSTLFYNSNVPVSSKLYYSYSIPLVDTVAQTASISDEQDVMIIDLATQVAVMEMLLM